MPNPPLPKPEPPRIGLWVTLAVALVYCVWLGWHWLPLDYSDKELSAFVSRVWDTQRELTEHGRLPWWTPYFMSGSSYGLNYSHGLYLVPWLLLGTMFSLPVAGKLCALLAIFGGAVAMYFCARHFLRNEWGAALAALAFLFHPEQIIRSAGAEHMTIIMFLPFIPLTWWLFARALDTGKVSDAFWCSVGAVGMLGMDNKQALIQYTFLAGYLVFKVGQASRLSQQREWTGRMPVLLWIVIFSLGLGAFFLVTGLVESKHVKLFYGDPIEGWQRNYAFKSLLGLVDRNGAITRQAVDGAVGVVQARGGVRSQAELEQVQRVAGLQMDAPEKYAGLVLLAVIAVTALFNHDRVNRWLFWFFVGMLLLTVMLGSGLSNVGGANWQTWRAVMTLEGVPGSARNAVWLAVLAVAAFLALLFRRKLTTTRKRVVAGAALLVFLFLPAFRLLAIVPFFKEVRAPFVFYDLPAVFFGALLAGFFVTDVLRAAKPAGVIAGLGVLLLVDYWPYQNPMKTNGVPARTLQNLRATYEALAADPDPVKAYPITGRYFHLLGPMWSGKPQVSEAFYNWMCPLGMGLLNQQAGPELWQLIGARYIIFDKTDPSANAQTLTGLRPHFPTVVIENEDFVVLRNDHARPYLTAYLRACGFLGDVRQSPRLALALSGKGWPMVHLAGPQTAPQYERVYAPPAEVRRWGGLPNLYEWREDSPPLLPVTPSEPVELQSVKLQREHAGRLRIELTALAPCTLVIAESYYPFWRATVDGKPAEVLRVSCGLMGLSLPAGQHSIVLRYQPPRAYAVAGVVSGLTLLIGVGLTIRATRSSVRGRA